MKIFNQYNEFIYKELDSYDVSVGAPVCDELLLRFLYKWQYDGHFSEPEINRLYERCFTFLSQEIVPFSYIDGILGIHWFFNHLQERGYFKDKNLLLTQLSAYIHESAVNDVNICYLEPLYGLGAKLLFFTRNKKYEELNECVSLLFEKHTRNNVLVSLEDGSNNFYGRAHGAIGFLSCLLLSYDYLNSQNKRSVELVCDLFNRELQGALLDSDVSFLPCKRNSSTDDNPPERLAWCYGDFGLYQYLKLLNDKKVEINFLPNGLLEDVKRKICERSLENAYVNITDDEFPDIGICHGLTGILLQLEYYEISSPLNYWHLELKKSCDIMSKSPLSDNYESKYNFLEGVLGLGLTIQKSEGKYFLPWEELLWY